MELPDKNEILVYDKKTKGLIEQVIEKTKVHPYMAVSLLLNILQAGIILGLVLPLVIR